MVDEADPRLRAFVHGIVLGAGVPRGRRDDVEEEMLGHLVERAAAERAAGATDDDAIDRAIAEFGDPSALAADLGRSFHSRLWATTVGVLLAERASLGQRPAPVTALAWLVAIAASVSALGAVLIAWNGTPLRAIVAGGGLLLFVPLAVVILAALVRGQVWAFWCAIVIASELLVYGIDHSAHAPPGTTDIPIGAIAAGIVLLCLLWSTDGVRRFFAGSRPIGPRLAAGVGGALALTIAAPVVAMTLPDPTQATPADVDMAMTMECGQRPYQVPDGPLVPNQRYATIDVRMGWRRGDVLPFGIGGPFGGRVGGDTAGFRILAPGPGTTDAEADQPAWFLLVTDPVVRIVETGETAGWFGSTSPSQALIPDTIGSFTVGIENDRIAGGRTVEIEWTIGLSSDTAPFSPIAEVAYAHLDRFLLLGTVECGQRAHGGPDHVAAPDSQVLRPPWALGP